MKPSTEFLAFTRFFHDEVPPELFAMSASPQLMRTMQPQLQSDIVGFMRLFAFISQPDNQGEYIDPPTFYSLDHLLFYKLALGRGCINGMDYAVNLQRFDRFPPVMRKEMALDALLKAAVQGEPEWYRSILNRAGHNATLNVVEWRGGMGQKHAVSG